MFLHTRLTRVGLLLGLLAWGGTREVGAEKPQIPASQPTTRKPPSQATSPAAPSPTAPTFWLEKGKRFIDDLQKGHYSEIYATFDKPMKNAMSPGTLQQFWTTLQLQVGKLETIFDSEAQQVQGGLWIVLLDLRFQRTSFTFRLVFRATQELAGFNVRPFQDRKNPLPPYAMVGRYTETKVTIGQTWPLSGTLTLPKDQGPGPWPAVVLVHGSGPHDQDESIGFFKPFRDIAVGLASRGVITLRYTKRTHLTAHGAALAKLPNLTLVEETIEDAVLAARFLQTHPEVDPKRIVIAGHSLGGIAAPRIAKAASFVGGLILLAATPRPLEDVILDQITYILGLEKIPPSQAQAQIKALQAQVALVKSPSLTPTTSASLLPLSLPASYWLDLRANPPGPLLAQLHLPTLVLQGERDYQVLPTKDFQAWKTILRSHKKATFFLFPKLNHLFVSGEGPGSPKDYQGKGHVEFLVIEEIASWLSNLPATPRKPLSNPAAPR